MLREAVITQNIYILHKFETKLIKYEAIYYKISQKTVLSRCF